MHNSYSTHKKRRHSSRSRSKSRSRSPSNSYSRRKRSSYEDAKHGRTREDYSAGIRSHVGGGGGSETWRREEASATGSSKKHDVHISREKRREDNSSKPCSSFNFDMKLYRSYFDRMFFRIYDVIVKGSPQYEDFWKFYDKIQSIQQQRKIKSQPAQRQTGSAKTGPESASVKVGKLHLPEKYSKKLTIPFQLQYQETEDYIKNLNPDDQEYVRSRIPTQVIQDFLQTLIYFLDFLQKERFSKLKKLRESQASLPIAQFKDEILSTLSKHSVLIVVGDTGCGKSTQIPQYLLKAGYTGIACTQPRRIACLSLCKRVAHETLNEFGSEVGYQIRFEKRKTAHTKVVFITEGLLLRQVSTESLLTNYNVIVLDEVHERHLHGDFLLGIVKCLLYQRTDVKVILMSATISTDLFQNYFQGLAPILQVPGRLFPIKMQYRPVSIEELNTKSSRINPTPYVRILQLIDDKFPKDERGDVLVFLSGLNEITTVVEAAQVYAEQTKRWIILSLHSMLSIEDQDKAFDYPPEGVRKCIFSTNIAETSITIDGIRFVVDSGKVKEMAYDPSCKMQRLKEFWISKASAEQRKGRAGRTGPGVCFRLYSEEDYQNLQAYSTPEIQRVPLDSLLLQMISIGIPDCRKFPFIEPPALESIETSILRLKQQEALAENESLTSIGQTLSQLPVDVTIGKMLIMGTLFDQIDAVLSLAAALSVQSPFTNWAHRDPDCVAARKPLDSDHGDPFTLLNAYRAWLTEKAESDSNRTKKWCKRRGFEEQRFYEMTKLRQQFKTLLKDSGLINEKESALQLSSTERSMRHGEVKQLRQLKKEYHMAAPRKKKILKFEDGIDAADASDQEVDNGDIDIRDVEFRLRNDSKQVKDLLQQSTPYGHEDLVMLKIILCSGLYPSCAIADDFNKFKSDADQVYHTREKPFTVLHPMGVFANQPDILTLADSDIISVRHMNTKLPISSKHQLLCYMNLLETNKPYLMNTFRMPAVQTLFLFAHTIDSDHGFIRFVFDSWLEVEFVSSASARTITVSAMDLRHTWSNLLTERLAKKDEIISKLEVQRGRELNSGLVSFMRCEAFYTVRRLLAADQKNMHNKEPQFPPDDFYDETGMEVRQNNAKGGLALTPYFTYSCLYGEIPEPEEWECSLCKDTFSGPQLILLKHQISCRRKKAQETCAETELEESHTKPFSKTYFCITCQKNFNLTPMEILRHKRQH